MNTSGVESLRRLGGLITIALLGLSCAVDFTWLRGSGSTQCYRWPWRRLTRSL